MATTTTKSDAMEKEEAEEEADFRSFFLNLSLNQKREDESEEKTKKLKRREEEEDAKDGQLLESFSSSSATHKEEEEEEEGNSPDQPQKVYESLCFDMPQVTAKGLQNLSRSWLETLRMGSFPAQPLYATAFLRTLRKECARSYIAPNASSGVAVSPSPSSSFSKSSSLFDEYSLLVAVVAIYGLKALLTQDEHDVAMSLSHLDDASFHPEDTSAVPVFEVAEQSVLDDHGSQLIEEDPDDFVFDADSDSDNDPEYFGASQQDGDDFTTSLEMKEMTSKKSEVREQSRELLESKLVHVIRTFWHHNLLCSSRAWNELPLAELIIDAINLARTRAMSTSASLFTDEAPSGSAATLREMEELGSYLLRDRMIDDPKSISRLLPLCLGHVWQLKYFVVAVRPKVTVLPRIDQQQQMREQAALALLLQLLPVPAPTSHQHATMCERIHQVWAFLHEHYLWLCARLATYLEEVTTLLPSLTASSTSSELETVSLQPLFKRVECRVALSCSMSLCSLLDFYLTTRVSDRPRVLSGSPAYSDPHHLLKQGIIREGLALCLQTPSTAPSTTAPTDCLAMYAELGPLRRLLITSAMLSPDVAMYCERLTFWVALTTSDLFIRAHAAEVFLWAFAFALHGSSSPSTVSDGIAPSSGTTATGDNVRRVVVRKKKLSDDESRGKIKDKHSAPQWADRSVNLLRMLSDSAFEMKSSDTSEAPVVLLGLLERLSLYFASTVPSAHTTIRTLALERHNTRVGVILSALRDVQQQVNCRVKEHRQLLHVQQQRRTSSAATNFHAHAHDDDEDNGVERKLSADAVCSAQTGGTESNYQADGMSAHQCSPAVKGAAGPHSHADTDELRFVHQFAMMQIFMKLIFIETDKRD